MRDGLPDPPRLAASLPPELMIWLSPGFPVGAFAYSHGLEAAVARGLVSDEAGLAAWIGTLLTCGSLRSDLVLAACAWRAAKTNDGAALAAVNDLAIALQPGAERRLETVTQGGAFVRAICEAWPAAARWPEALAGTEVAYPIAVAASASVLPSAIEPMLSAFAIAAVGNMTSAAIRLSVTGQTGAQRVIAGAMGTIATAVDEAAGATLEDLGSAAFMSDLCSLLHETQYTRLFRS